MVSVAQPATGSSPVSSTTKQPSSIFEMPVESILGWLLVCGCAFLNLANVLVDKDEVGLDFQVLMKLGLIGLGGLYGLHGALTRPNVRRVLISFPVAWLLIILVFFIAAVPFSSSPRNSLVSTSSVAAILLMMITALDHLGVLNTLKAVFFGMAMFIVGSWAAYFLVPDIGIMAEPIDGGNFVYRMSGLAHPNTLGQYSGLAFVFSIILYFSYRQQNMFVVIIGLLALGALVNSYSRTSLMACGMAIIIGYRHIYIRREYLGFYTLGFATLLLGGLILSTQMDIGAKLAEKAELLSKSEDSADELTTATGRSEIWAHALHLLKDRPLTGYGAATQKYFFEDYSYYTHNLVLNIAFGAGAFAGIAAVLMILGRLRALFHIKHPLADAIVVFIVINGLFENVIFSILAGLPTMLWILALAWPLLADDPAVKELCRTPERQTEEHSRCLRLESS